MKRSCVVLFLTNLFGRDFLPPWSQGPAWGGGGGEVGGDCRRPKATCLQGAQPACPTLSWPLSCPRPSYAASEESRILVLAELLERKAHSPFYQEGVSNALLKMAELGLTRAAAVLLRNGANLNFEGPPEPGGLGWIDGLSVACRGWAVRPPGSALICLRGDA